MINPVEQELYSNENKNEASNKILTNSFSLFQSINVNSPVKRQVKIENKIDQNNCFINVLIHTINHFPNLVNYLISSDFQYLPSTPLLPDLINLLQAYRKLELSSSQISGSYVSDNILNPKNFRVELAKHFKPKNLYQLNDQGDPIELFLYLLNSFHSLTFSKTNIEPNERQCSPVCISHELFSINLHERFTCPQCKTELTIKYDPNYFVYEMYASEFMNLIEFNNLDFKEFNGKIFSLYKSVIHESNKTCEKCKGVKMSKQLLCDSLGKFLVINIIWQDPAPKMKEICKLYFSWSKVLQCNEMFDCEFTGKEGRYLFKGMILFYMMHFVCVFYEKKSHSYIFYNDDSTRHFEDFAKLVDFTLKNHYFPIGVIYENIGSDIVECGDYFGWSEEMYLSHLTACEDYDTFNEKNKEISNDNFDNKHIWDDFDNMNAKEEYEMQDKTKARNENQNEIQEKDKKMNQTQTKEPLLKLESDEWKCEYCKTIIKNSTSKCNNCNIINHSIRELCDQKQKQIQRKYTNWVNNETDNTPGESTEQPDTSNNYDIINKDKTQSVLPSNHSNLDTKMSNQSNVLNLSQIDIQTLQRTSLIHPLDSDLLSRSSKTKQDQDPQTSKLVTWECEFCKGINEDNTYKCAQCKKENESMKQFIVMKEQLETGEISLIPRRCPFCHYCVFQGNLVNGLCPKCNKSVFWKCMYCGMEFNNYDNKNCAKCWNPGRTGVCDKCMKPTKQKNQTLCEACGGNQDSKKLKDKTKNMLYSKGK